MKNKTNLLLSGLLFAVNILWGDSEKEEDVFTLSNETQPVITKNKTRELKTQIISNKDVFYEDHELGIEKGMDQYIITFPIYDTILDKILTKLKPFHTDKAKKLGKKTIIFKYQTLLDPEELIEDTDEFSIESFDVYGFITHDKIEEFGKIYNTLIKYGKPIIFSNVDIECKNEIEKTYDLSNCKITYFGEIYSFDEYLETKNLGIKSLRLNVIMSFKPCLEEQNLKKHLESLLRHIKTYSKEDIKQGLESLLNLLKKDYINRDLKYSFEAVSKEDWENYERRYSSRLKHAIKDLIEETESIKEIPFWNEKELRKQLYTYIRDRQVTGIEIKEKHLTNNYEGEAVSIPIEYASCFFKLFFNQSNETKLINSKNTEDILFVPSKIRMLEKVACNTLFCNSLNEEVGTSVSCKTIICQDFNEKVKVKNFIHCLDKINNLKTVYLNATPKFLNKLKKGNGLDKVDSNLIEYLTEKNISLRFYDAEKVYKLFKLYKKYIEEKNIVHLSGYVNVNNKPHELSVEEWRQVGILKQKVQEMITSVQTESVNIPN